VAHLSSEMPLEGGIYQWVKLRFSPLLGFLVALDLWMTNLFVVAQAGVLAADNAPYMFGPSGSWIPGNRAVIISVSFATVIGLGLLAWRGLAAGKWVNNFGGFCTVFLFAAMIAVALPHWFHGDVAIAPLAWTFPAVSLLNLNLLGKMGFGALSGFDGVAIFAGEFRATDVARPIRRSVWIAAPLISSMFILGTASVLVFTRPEGIDLVSPISQVLSHGAPRFAGPAAFLLVMTFLTQAFLSLTIMTRMPMVAGWDHLLPAWFSRLDPRYKTPVGSVVFGAASAIAVAVLANLGTGNQEAFQLITNAGISCYACTYLLMFAIPLVARGERPNLTVRIAAASGFLMTLLFLVLSVFPIIDVQNPWAFTAKIVGTVATIQGAGALYYLRASRILTSIRGVAQIEQ
jgi:amino acid transporter